MPLSKLYNMQQLPSVTVLIDKWIVQSVYRKTRPLNPYEKMSRSAYAVFLVRICAYVLKNNLNLFPLASFVLSLETCRPGLVACYTKHEIVVFLVSSFRFNS